METYYVYIISNVHHTVFYTGFTSDIFRRTSEHRNKIRKSFTAKYNCCKLLYYEEFDNAADALHRERLVKRYKRAFTYNLINSMNPEWEDLFGILA
ncbi:GIY-YIG nuclease family protein [Roseivirga sp. BDSF3-8]|uniref:GIY-YIG nuclease family protein n=1 Tax=Roseivirga sp. BDSF3-8 TaxID=3241598 RepID=UPI00353260B1